MITAKVDSTKRIWISAADSAISEAQRMTRAAEALPSLPSTTTISQASMTTFATRPPLQQLDNPHIMSQRGNGRRTSARLADKDNAPTTDGYVVESMKKSQPATGGKQSKANPNGVGPKIGGKRKPGEYTG